MSVTVLVRYLADLERWEIGIDWALGRTDLVMLDDEVSEGRLPTGGVAELVIDATVPSTMALRRIAAAFGTEVADIVRQAGGSDLERAVTAPDATPVASGVDGGSPAVLPGEAGLVRPSADVETAGDTGAVTSMAIEPWVEPGLPVHGQVEMTVERHDTELIVRVRGVEHHDHVWVRISDAASGSLLAMTRLRPSSTAAPTDEPPAASDRPAGADFDTSAALTFGLDHRLHDLYITVTDSPLDPVPARRERRAQWCDRLLARARSTRFTRPAASAALAGQAHEVATANGDAARQHAARNSRRAAIAVRWGRAAVAVALIALVVGLLIGRSGSDDDIDAEPQVPATAAPGVSATSEPSEPSETIAPTVPDTSPVPTAAPTTSTAVTTTTSPIDLGDVRPFGGPALFRFDEPDDPDDDDLGVDSLGGAGEVNLVVLGAPIVRRDSEATLTMRFTHSYWSTFSHNFPDGGTPESREAAVRQTCFGALTGVGTTRMTGDPPSPFEFLVRVLSVPEADGGAAGIAPGTSFVFTSVRIDEPVVRVQTFERRCRETPLDERGLTTVARFTRGAAAVDIEFPSSIPVGLWSLELLLPDGTVAAVNPPPLVLVLDP